MVVSMKEAVIAAFTVLVKKITANYLFILISEVDIMQEVKFQVKAVRINHEREVLQH